MRAYLARGAGLATAGGSPVAVESRLATLLAGQTVNALLCWLTLALGLIVVLAVAWVAYRSFKRALP